MVEFWLDTVANLARLIDKGPAGPFVIGLAKWLAVAGLLLLLLRWLPMSRARLRHDLAVVVMLSLPVVLFLVAIGWSIPLSAGAPLSKSEFLSTFSVRYPAVEAQYIGLFSYAGKPSRMLNPWGEAVAQLVFLTWLAGVFVFAAQALCQWWRLRNLLKAATRATPEAEVRYAGLLEGKAELLISTEAAGPFVTGSPPKVVLPDDDEDHTVVIRHELAHVKAGDLWAGWITVLCKVLLWPIPLVWICTKLAEESREVACDAVAVRNGERFHYARLLQKYAMAPATVGTSFAKDGNSLLARIRLLQDQPAGVKAANRRYPFLCLTILLLVTVAASLETGPGLKHMDLVFRNDIPLPEMVNLLDEPTLQVARADFSRLQPVRVWVTSTGQDSTRAIEGLELLTPEFGVKRDALDLPCVSGAGQMSAAWVLELPSHFSKSRARLLAEAVGLEVCMVNKDPNWVPLLVPVEMADSVARVLVADQRVLGTSLLGGLERDGVGRTPERDMGTWKLNGGAIRIPGQWKTTLLSDEALMFEAPGAKASAILTITATSREDELRKVLTRTSNLPQSLITALQTSLSPTTEMWTRYKNIPLDEDNPAKRYWDRGGETLVAYTGRHEGQSVELRAAGQLGFISDSIPYFEIALGDAIRTIYQRSK